MWTLFQTSDVNQKLFLAFSCTVSCVKLVSLEELPVTHENRSEIFPSASQRLLSNSSHSAALCVCVCVFPCFLSEYLNFLQTQLETSGEFCLHDRSVNSTWLSNMLP